MRCIHTGNVSGWCGACYAYIRGRAASRHGVYRSLPKGNRLMEGEYVKRPSYGGKPPIPGGPAAPPPGGFDKYPLLWEAMADPFYEDGTARQTHSLLVFSEMGELKVCLSDRENGMVLFRTGPSLASCLAALEKALEGNNGDWRASRSTRKR